MLCGGQCSPFKERRHISYSHLQLLLEFFLVRSHYREQIFIKIYGYNPRMKLIELKESENKKLLIFYLLHFYDKKSE